MNTVLKQKNITKHKNKKIIKQFFDNDIKVILEIPVQNDNHSHDNCVEDIKKIMNNELLLQIKR